MKHYYFVSYYSKINNEWGQGWAEIDVNAKITKGSQIKTLQNKLQDEGGFHILVIQNFQLLRRSRS